MRVLQCLIPVSVSFLLISCGYLGDDAKVKQEQAWLAEHQQLQQAVELIREQGLDTVLTTAEAGSVAACVAARLSADPVGQLVTVEGALAESAKVAQLLADLQRMLEQEMDLMQLSNLLQQGAELAAYAKTMIDQQGFEQALVTLKQMLQQSQNFAQQNLGGHLQQVLQSCELPANTEQPQ